MKPILFKQIQDRIPPVVWPVLFIGLIIRVFAWYFTYIINPDGMLYIHQARAFYYGQWDSIMACGLKFFSNYPVLIAGAYTLFHNWITAASLVSLFFSFITLIPLYLLLKIFFSDKIAVPSLLVFALIPIFVGRSADVVRGPVFWFFLILGIYFFIKQVERQNKLYILMASLSFLMAAWARTEALLFVAVSCFYLLVSKQPQKAGRLFYFFLPLILIIILCIASGKALNVSAKSFYRLDRIQESITEPLEKYREVRNDLAELAIQQNRVKSIRWFLPEARNFVWLIALGTLMNRFFEAIFYPFALIFLIGLGGLWKRVKLDTRVFYLSLLVLAATVLLYARTIQTWMVYYRFMATLVLPGCIFIGFGIQKIIGYCQKKTRLKESTIVIIVCIFILISALPKNLQKRGEDKRFISQIGELISEREGNSQVIPIAAAYSSLGTWVSFYANLNYQGPYCPSKTNCDTVSYQRLLQYMKKKRIKYFIYEEKRWENERFDFIDSKYDRNFKELKRWQHPDTGRVILFELF